MMQRTKTAIALTTTILLAAACGENATEGGGGHTTSHEYDPVHGGELVHLGAHKHMIEVKHDEGAGEIHVWVFDPHHSPVDKLPAAPELVLPDGKSLYSEGSKEHYVFKNDALKEHLHGIRFKVQVWERGEAASYETAWHAEH